MFILTTLDENYPQIWEKNGTATFSSRYEGNIVPHMQALLHKSTVYAAGIYRPCRKMPQEYAPSLLQITGARRIQNSPPYVHDLAIDFIFIGKMPVAANRLLNSFKPEARPLIIEVEDLTFLRRLLQSLSADNTR